MLQVLLTLGLAVTSINAFADYAKLSDARNNIKFPTYSLAEKKLVLDQTKLILNDVYVNKDIKIKDFGTSADPTPRLESIEKNIHNITDEQFHQSLHSIFQSFHDFHTLYYFPKPFACYQTFLPVMMKYVRTGPPRGNIFVVSALSSDSAIYEHLQQPFPVKVGDRILTYNGKKISEAIEEIRFKTGGANPAATFRRAQEFIRYREHALDFVPEEDSVEIGFENQAGEKYNLTIPWIAYADEECLAGSEGPEEKLTGSSGEEEEPILYWTTLRNDRGTYGYIELTSFNPEVFSNEDVVKKVKDILLTELNDTKGIVFDLRDNEGGQIPLAEMLIQLFSPNPVEPLKFTLKNTETNYFYMRVSDPLDPFTLAMETARKLGLPYTQGEVLDTYEQINNHGQVYFKPVAVFVNSKCYSSCDMFAAQMQDHNSGIIFGEDASTGGGGANSFDLNQLVDSLRGADSGPYKKLSSGQNIKYAFRQTIRVGKSAGKLIENVGVTADVQIPMSLSDISNRTETQLTFIKNYLANISGTYSSNAHFEKDDRIDFTLFSKPFVKARWENTNLIDQKVNGNILSTETVELKDEAMIDFSEGIRTNTIHDGRIEVQGRLGMTNVWRKIINFRIIPDYQTLRSDQNLINHFAFYTTSTKAENGWMLEDGALRIGSRNNYTNDVNAEASLFARLPDAATELSFDATILTEKDCDFFSVSILSEGKETIVLKKISGEIHENEYKIDLSEFSGKAVEIRMLFTSDSGLTAPGVSLRNIRIK
jgi:C-terminal processing protease CtpA/Prc